MTSGGGFVTVIWKGSDDALPARSRTVRTAVYVPEDV
jgi:hypothetical protein